MFSYLSLLIYYIPFGNLKPMAIPTIPKLKQLDQLQGGSKNAVKGILIGMLALLLGAFGLQATNNDFDLGKLLSGSTLKESKVATDSKGNILFDKQGNVTTDSTKGKKASDYNCPDFGTQPEAQAFYKKVGGVSNDIYRLDANKDGVACQDLRQNPSK